MRVFRASDKMSANEPMSLTKARGWDPISGILPRGDIVFTPFLMLVGTLRRL
jgi:hypothetical protein